MMLTRLQRFAANSSKALKLKLAPAAVAPASSKAVYSTTQEMPLAKVRRARATTLGTKTSGRATAFRGFSTTTTEKEEIADVEGKETEQTTGLAAE